MTFKTPQWLAITVALLLVNAAASFHNLWPTPWITLRPEISVEAAAIVLLVLIAAGTGRMSPRLIGGLSVVLMFLAAARYMEVTAPALYGRAINLYWDSQHLPAVVAMMTDSIPAWTLIAGVLGALLSLAAFYLALRWALSNIGTATAARPFIGWAAAGLICIYTIGYYASVGPVLRWFSIPVTQTYVRQLEFIAEAMAGGAEAALPDSDPFNSWSWPHRPQTDVFVVFVESYGSIAYDAEEVAREVAPHRKAFAAAVTDSGGQIASAFVTSPTFGGVSWLAHSSFMTGIDVTDSGAYDLLLTQQRETLPDRFRAAGYRTVALMPGLRGNWPEGSFYGFDRIYGERDIDYSGPEFGWWRIPDQFALARVADNELSAADRQRLFLFFPTINTHMPFRPTPPYQPDWQALNQPEPFEQKTLEQAMAATPNLTDLRPAYAGALSYTFDYLGGFVSRRTSGNWLLLILGDHQPPASVTGAGARWDVPAHVASGDPQLLEAFLARGFVIGSDPDTAPVARTHELGDALLEALGATHAAQ